ncbi:MAG TPA: hypothetical protein VNY05_13665 [Candidatus Acidoferrales bacterium]|jgi:hypothetical protein|nr:hypothetical protein [Candidatus Acidoferrales bacterium]
MSAPFVDARDPMALKKTVDPKPLETALRPPETALQREVGAVSASAITGSFTDNYASAAGVAATVAPDEQATPLFAPGEAKEFRARWDTIQGGFVDEPRHAVEQADSLVADAMKRLAEVFADERAKLEGQWDSQESVSTEDLRLALRRYRSFFGRLLSV